jgi:hypothetical protein
VRIVELKVIYHGPNERRRESYRYVHRLRSYRSQGIIR